MATSFDIEFTGDEPELQDEGWYELWGRVTLGEVVEYFLAPLSLWSREDYERQWLEAAARSWAGMGRKNVADASIPPVIEVNNAAGREIASIYGDCGDGGSRRLGRR